MKKIENLSGYRMLTKNYPYYKADVFTAHLVEDGYNLNQIIISRKNVKTQGFLRDIDEISLIYPDSNPDTPFLRIDSGRCGIYDSLPENMFYSPEHNLKDQDRTAIIKRIKSNRQIEKSVRKFFSLFEIEIDQFLSYIQVENLKHDKGYSYKQSSNLFRKNCNVITIMNESESQRFLRIVPFVYQIRGNIKETSLAISFILGIKVDIRSEFIYDDKEPLTPYLSEMYLGDNSVLHSKKGEIKENSILIIVSELDIEKCREYFEGEKKNYILRYLIDFFGDVTISYIIKIIPKKEYCYFDFGLFENEPYLDVNTYLYESTK